MANTLQDILGRNQNIGIIGKSGFQQTPYYGGYADKAPSATQMYAGANSDMQLIPVYAQYQDWTNGHGEWKEDQNTIVGYTASQTIEGSGDAVNLKFDPDGKLVDYDVGSKGSSAFIPPDLVKFLAVAAGGAFAAANAAGAAGGGAMTAAGSDAGVIGLNTIAGGTPIGAEAGLSAAGAANGMWDVLPEAVDYAPEIVENVGTQAGDYTLNFANATTPATDMLPSITDAADAYTGWTGASTDAITNAADAYTGFTGASTPLATDAASTLPDFANPSIWQAADAGQTGLSASKVLEALASGTITPTQALTALAGGDSSTLAGTLAGKALTSVDGLISNAFSSKYVVGAGLSLLSSWLKNKQFVEMSEEQRRLYNRNVGSYV